MLVGDLWTLLDGGDGDYHLTAPRAHPLDPMDRASHKVHTSLSTFIVHPLSVGIQLAQSEGWLERENERDELIHC